MKQTTLAALILIVIVLSACSQESEPAPAASEPQVADTATVEEAGEATGAVDEGTREMLEQQPTALPSVMPTATSEPLAASPESIETTEAVGQGDLAAQGELVVPGQPIEITYFTPSQGEGPYYPVNKLDDRDSDLTVLAGASGVAAGQIVEFGGTVYDASGMPQSGIVVEIWQTDSSGVYLHPGDPGTDQRDMNFQFYGESITSADGRYSFRTILPGRYEPRPRHIHVKVKLDGQELLTTQFYFADDPDLAGEAMFAQVGEEGESLIIMLEESQDVNGNPILVGQRDIVLNMAL